MKRLSFLGLLSLLALQALANADQITQQLSGKVTQIQINTYTGATQSTFSVGDQITGSYTYDASAPLVSTYSDLPSFNDVRGRYDALTSLDINVGSYHATSGVGGGPFSVQVTNSVPRGQPAAYADTFTVASFGPNAGSIFPGIVPGTLTGPSLGVWGAVDQLGFVYYDWTGTVFSNTDLPQSPLDLTQFNDSYFTLRFASQDGSILEVDGQLDGVSPLNNGGGGGDGAGTVPEPTSLIALAGLGAMGLIGCVWRRRKRLVVCSA